MPRVKHRTKECALSAQFGRARFNHTHLGSIEREKKKMQAAGGTSRAKKNAANKPYAGGTSPEAGPGRLKGALSFVSSPLGNGGSCCVSLYSGENIGAQCMFVCVFI